MTTAVRTRGAAVVLAVVTWTLETRAGRDWYVVPGASSAGTGTKTAPFGRIQSALDVAQPGDVVHVGPGVYLETLRTTRAGASGAPITIRADGARGSAVVTTPGRVLTVDHPHVAIQGLVLDGQYGPADTVRVSGLGSGLSLVDVEVRASGRDCIDIGAATAVLIDRSLIHHCLNAAQGRTDAHGIVAGAVRDLAIRNTAIHTFSGDAVQLDPARAAPGWDRVRIEGCRFWLAPLDRPENGFAAGVVPGENAIDTKTWREGPRSTLVVRDTDAWGFRNGLIANMAAFNLKEAVDATLDRVTVRDSEIAFRVRGSSANPAAGARVQLQNTVVHDVAVGVRYENDIQVLRIWHATFGRGVVRAFRPAAAERAVPDVRNALFLGGTLPREAAGPTNRAVGENSFVAADRHDYRLAPGAAAIDAGVPLPGIATDRAGTSRPQGRTVDIGAYEACAGGCGPGADTLHAVAGREGRPAAASRAASSATVSRITGGTRFRRTSS
jgi:hypothetical protein